MNENTTKKKISHAEFEKRVEIEATNLMYFEYMRKEKAFRPSSCLCFKSSFLLE